MNPQQIACLLKAAPLIHYYQQHQTWPGNSADNQTAIQDAYEAFTGVRIDMSCRGCVQEALTFLAHRLQEYKTINSH